MTGINLNAIVAPAIGAVHPHVAALLYQSIGQSTVAGGQVKASYAEPIPITAQAQSESATALYHADKVGLEDVSRKFYLNSTPAASNLVTGIYRPLSRNGDLLQIDPAEEWFGGSWWLVDALIEDFSRAGWVCVRARLQINGPDLGAGG